MKRILLAVFLAGAGVTAVAYPPPAPPVEEKKEVKRWEFPKADAKEWKKKDSGLEVWDLVEGKGNEAKADDSVTIRYTGWNLDGKIFDTTEKDDKNPATFPLKRLIKGWQEGIPGMKPGGVRRLKIPAALAYGDRGAGDDIAPGATLIFEVELIESK